MIAELSDEKLARLIHRALTEDSPAAHIDDFDVDDRLVIDGRFDLLGVARFLKNALTNPPEAPR